MEETEPDVLLVNDADEETEGVNEFERDGARDVVGVVRTVSDSVGNEEREPLRFGEAELVLVTDTEADIVLLCVSRDVTRGEDEKESEPLAEADAVTLWTSTDTAGDDDTDGELDIDTVLDGRVVNVTRIEGDDKGDALS